MQAVKDTLDWREQFKKRPVVWSAGAMGVGFCVGYCVASFVKGDEHDDYSSAIDRFGEESKYYTAQSVLGSSAAAMSMPTQAGTRSRQGNGTHEEGPGFFQKVANTPAFDRVKQEAGNIGDAVVKELSNTAKTVVLPALITSLRNFIGGYLPHAEKSQSTSPSQRDQSRGGTSSYQPSLERNPT